MTDRDQLIEDAKEAINKVFGDTSVSKSETKEDLEDIASDIQVMIDSLDE